MKVVQGTTTLQAGNMTVFYKAGGGSVTSGNADIDRIEVNNKVFLSSGTQQATGESGIVNLTTRRSCSRARKSCFRKAKTSSSAAS